MPTFTGQWQRLPQEKKTPDRAPPCQELDIKLVFVQKITFFLGKSTKAAANRAALFDSSMHQVVCQLGLRRRPH